MIYWLQDLWYGFKFWRRKRKRLNDPTERVIIAFERELGYYLSRDQVANVVLVVRNRLGYPELYDAVRQKEKA